MKLFEYKPINQLLQEKVVEKTPKFGRKSKAVLITCHPELQRLMNEVIKYFNFSALSGRRTQEEQDDLVRKGLSKRKDSYHVNDPSLAIDIAPYPIDWNNIDRFCYLAGLVKMKAYDMGIPITWGRNWDNDQDFDDQIFMDYGHFQYEGK